MGMHCCRDQAVLICCPFRCVQEETDLKILLQIVLSCCARGLNGMFGEHFYREDILKKEKDMKKKGLIGLFSVALSTVILCSLFLSGCDRSDDDHDNNTHYQEDEQPFTISAPYVVSLGNIIRWDACKNADEYVIFQDDVKILTTTETQVEVEDASTDHKYTVIARNTENNTESEKSNIALVSKSFGFGQNEILELDPQELGTYYTISSSIRKIVCKSDEPMVVESNFIIHDREYDLFFELENITFSSMKQAVITTQDGTYSRADQNWNLIFTVSGKCGVKGMDQTFVPAQPSDNTEKRGSNGMPGTDAIVAPTVVVRGSGEFTVSGGDGGVGGRGANSTTWATNYYGDGGNGGVGGDGIVSQFFVLQMESDGVVYVNSGIGGARGAPGVNGSILTGPWSTADYNEHYGTAGKNGTALRGSIITLGGTLYD